MIIKVTIETPDFCAQEEVFTIKDYSGALGHFEIADSQIECVTNFESKEVTPIRFTNYRGKALDPELTTDQFTALDESIKRIIGLPVQPIKHWRINQ